MAKELHKNLPPFPPFLKMLTNANKELFCETTRYYFLET